MREELERGAPVRAPKIALIHAVSVAMEPIAAAFAEHWPQTRTFNLLDDALSTDRAATDDLTEQMKSRILGLARYAHLADAEAILFTCSAFGPAIEAAASVLPIPVLKPNEAMFAEALARGGDVAMVATFAPSVASMEAEFAAAATKLGLGARLHTVLVPRALDALKAGDDGTHNRLVAEAVAGLPECSAVMLAHFSTSRARALSAAATTSPVITSPDAAVRALQATFER